MAKLNKIENALRDYDIEITTTVDAVHVSMEYVHGEKGKELWTEINGVIRGLGGEWVRDGKDSHWSIPSSNEVAKPKTLGQISREQEEPKPTESFATIRCPFCSKPINITIGAPKT